MDLKGSKTEKNLLKAFAGESQARNRYTYAAGKARKEGFVQISQIFEETANQEKEHAKRFFSFLRGRRGRDSGRFSRGSGRHDRGESQGRCCGGAFRMGRTVPRVRAGGEGRGLRSGRHSVREDLDRGETARKALPWAPGQRRGRNRLQEGCARRVALHQLRVSARGNRGPAVLPCLCSSAGAFRALGRELVNQTPARRGM